MTTEPALPARESPIDPQASPGSADIGERTVILLICFLAGLRIFFFSAAFPFFNNVDEEAHLDLICKLAAGHLPKGLEPFGKEAASLITANRSPEYYQGVPGAEAFSQMTSLPEYWTIRQNYEATSPPVYYGLAAVWFKFGKVLGFAGRGLLYWIRFLNIPVFVFLVWLAYRFGRTAFSSLWHLRLGLPLIVAFLPQDVFYSINSSVLSASLVGMALLCLLKLYAQPGRNTRLCVVVGLLIAGSCLTSLMDLPLLAIASIVVVGKLRRSTRATDTLHQMFTIWTAALIPIGLWCTRNLVVGGGLTGTGTKINLLGWSLKPFGAIWSHPIFTLNGLITFWQGLMGTFWRGEFYWHGSRLASANADAFYSISSALFVGIGAITLLFAKRANEEKQKSEVVAISLISVLFFVGLLVVLSIVFDFGNCPYPSRTYPYLAAGRLISGAILPFFMVYLVGLDFVLTGLKRKWVCFGVILIVTFVATISEFHLSWSVLSSQYNWFHM